MNNTSLSIGDQKPGQSSKDFLEISWKDFREGFSAKIFWKNLIFDPGQINLALIVLVPAIHLTI